jgi:EmrB/QacA subfamily drug resistance transporter
VVAEAIHRRRWLILAGLVASEFVVELDSTIVNVALPNMSRSLGASTSDLQWVVDAYVLPYAALLLFAGTLADTIGSRRLLFAGLAAFAAGSTLAALSPGAWQLIGARAVTGIGAACVLPATLAVLVSVFTPSEYARAFSVWAVVIGLAFAVGPTLGGWLVEQDGWRAIFWINLPIVAGSLVAVAILVPASERTASSTPDVVGACLSIVGLTSVIYAVIEAPRLGWTSAPVLATFAAGALVLFAFASWENRAASPMLDTHLFHDRRFNAAVTTLGLTFLAIAGALFILTQYLQFGLHASPLAAGVRMLPVAIIFAAASPLSVVASRRLGTRVTVSGGLGLVATALGLMALLMSDRSGYGLVLCALLIGGAGMGMALTPATEIVLGALPPSRAGVSSAVNTTSLTLGIALGVAIMGSILSSRYHIAVSAFTHPAQPGTLRSIGSALADRAHQTTAQHALLAATARHVFVAAARPALLVGSVIAASGATLALALLPSTLALDSPNRKDSAAAIAAKAAEPS